MNKRIKDLLPNPFAVDYQYKDGPLDLYTEKEMLRFAELIVKECVTEISKQCGEVSFDDWDNGYDSGLNTAITTIEQYFGVEE